VNVVGAPSTMPGTVPNAVVTEQIINQALPSVLSTAQDFSALPNAGSSSGASNAPGNTSDSQSTTTFNALLEAAPTAAIGGDSESLVQILTESESYLTPSLSGKERDARLQCR
jgi:hypothetical protein